MTFTPRRLMDVASALLLLVALALTVWPVSAPTVRDDAAGNPVNLPPSPASPHALSTRSLADSTEAGIVRGNVFSSSRRAPGVRFVPPGSEGAAGTMTAPDPIPMPAASAGGMAGSVAPSDSTAPANADVVPTLYGIVSIDGTRRALLTLRAGEPPRLFAVGDRHAGFRINAIEPDRVTVQSARGSRTLRMARPASRDSSEKTP
jgi:hypothetical protein